jgi:CRP/FNR family transcriptional regulator, cyclic AMP receptor protein
MDTKDVVNFFSKIQMFSHLNYDEIEKVAVHAQFKNTSKFQFVFMQDEPSDYLYILKTGRLKTGSFAIDGREVIKEILQPNAVFGDLALTGEQKRIDFAQALSDEISYFSIKISDFHVLMQENQRLMFAAMQHLSLKLQRLEERLSSLILKDARERIIEFLVDTADKEGRQIGYEILIKLRITQQDIANLTGTSRQTVTAVLNDLRKSNLIHFTRNSFLIRDMAKLA